MIDQSRHNNPKIDDLDYSSVAMSGKPGAGRTTLLANLKPMLEPLGFEFFSGGEWARQFAVQNGRIDPMKKAHHKATDYDDDIDLKIDIAMREKLSDPHTHVAIESWIAGWNMRGMKHVLKVLLVCDDALRIDRVVNRDDMSVDEAKAHIRAREDANITKWERMYGVTDFWDPKYYDLVIDTYSTGPSETLDMVLEKLGVRSS